MQPRADEREKHGKPRAPMLAMAGGDVKARKGPACPVRRRSAGPAKPPMIPCMISSLGNAGAALSTQFRRFERSAARVAAPEREPELVRETVEQMASRHAIAANVAVARVSDELVGTLVDIFA
jgi:hypothetical protein